MFPSRVHNKFLRITHENLKKIKNEDTSLNFLTRILNSEMPVISFRRYVKLSSPSTNKRTTMHLGT